MPDLETINTMWHANLDGAGLCYWRVGESHITIDKGFMKLKLLRAKLDALALGKDDLAILHFRWATHGLVDPGNCHPFPLSSKMDSLRAIYGQFPLAIAHNGVFGNMCQHETLSDTQKFIAKVMCNPAIIGNLENSAVQELIRGYCGNSSKLAILKRGKLLLIGEFEEDKATGLQYSNSGYKKVNYFSRYTKDDMPVNEDDGCNWKSVDKKCELCDSETKVDYCGEVQLYLCDKCFTYNEIEIKHGRVD